MAEKRRAKFVIEFDLPDDVSVADAQSYVTDAVQSWSGSYDPEDERFGLGKDVVVNRFQREKTGRRARFRQAALKEFLGSHHG